MSDQAEPIVFKEFVVTPSMGKRLIAMAMVHHPTIQAVLKKGTLVIVAGSTNGYVAEEILKSISQTGFSRKSFFRGVTLPPKIKPKVGKFPGDVVIVDGVWIQGKDIFDVVDEMESGDVILKGANALDVHRRRAAVLIGHPMAGTAGASIPAVAGRRVRMIIPVGLEKRVMSDIADLAEHMDTPGAQGPRLLPLPGVVFTELDAIKLLTGASAELVAAGGIRGAEGAMWLAVSGSEDQIEAAKQIMASLADEPLCDV